MSALVKPTPEAQIREHPTLLNHKEAEEAFLDLVFELAVASLNCETQTPNDEG